MPLRGSILIVVLGLLAVLAVVGIAFVTMSSIESNSAANFALQAQFDLAADGAVDYVTQALIRDVWEFGNNTNTPERTATYRRYTGYMLTGKFGTWHWDWPDPVTPTGNMDESQYPWYPWPDAFLATSWSATTPPLTATTRAYSFRTTRAITQGLYNLNTWGGQAGTNAPYTGSATLDGSPNNLGIPTLTGATPVVYWYSTPSALANGYWLPELSFPYENGIIRVSVTVQDHAAMVNLNAHGTNNTWVPYGGTRGRGYFVCDLMPDGAIFPTTSIDRLLLNTYTPPGRWSAAGNLPGNVRLGEIFFQNPAVRNPAATQDRPFTLDDEFELRRLTGTYAQSRLEQISVAAVGTLDSTPGTTTATKVANRLGLTTVGWNAEVMPGQSTSQHKIDLNLATDQGGTSTLGFSLFETGAVWKQTTYPVKIRQFCANILAFKERYTPASGSNYYKPLYTNSVTTYGARRQPILSKVKVNVTRNSPSGSDTWDVHFQVFNPWYGNYAGDETNTGVNAGAIDTTNHQVKVYLSNSSTVAAGTFNVSGTTHKVAWKGVWDNSLAGGTTFTATTGQTLVKITMEVNTSGSNWLIIDQVLMVELGTIPITRRRLFGVYDEPRAADDTRPSCMGTVLYVKNRLSTDAAGVWHVPATDGSWNTLEGGTTEIASGAGIPIRFPHSVPTYGSTNAANRWDPLVNGPLPPYYNVLDTSGTGVGIGIFKAFLRVGDLNQVLCPNYEPTTAAPFWPWVSTVAAQSASITSSTGAPSAAEVAAEEAVKWDWWLAAESTVIDRTRPVFNSSITPVAAIVPTWRRYNAGNLFCVDSPWADSFDNDGDGVADNNDTGLAAGTGRFCGPENRVAGRINLNTATFPTLQALGLSLTGTNTTYTYLTDATTAANGGRPLTSPVEVLRYFATRPAAQMYSTNAECRGPLEKRDFWYTRISNIASTRSDTFSIYGTVQYVIPPDIFAFPTGSQNIADMRIVRTRRFWALVDRSPSLAFAPTNPNQASSFIRPRIMNFQWMD